VHGKLQMRARISTPDHDLATGRAGRLAGQEGENQSKCDGKDPRRDRGKLQIAAAGSFPVTDLAGETQSTIQTVLYISAWARLYLAETGRAHARI
jgi:hypothetical protein